MVLIEYGLRSSWSGSYILVSVCVFIYVCMHVCMCVCAWMCVCLKGGLSLWFSSEWWNCSSCVLTRPVSSHQALVMEFVSGKHWLFHFWLIVPSHTSHTHTYILARLSLKVCQNWEGQKCQLPRLSKMRQTVNINTPSHIHYKHAHTVTHTQMSNPCQSYTLNCDICRHSVFHSWCMV